MNDETIKNREAWDAYSDKYQRLHGSQLNRKEFVWGVWSIPEAELDILGNLENKKVLELGCGAAQLSMAVVHLGGNPVGIDNSPKQLEHAKRLLQENKIDLPLHLASSEKLPFEDSEFDIVFCDHGAISFAPTLPTLRETSRVLKKNGIFAFNIQTPFHETCYNEKNEKVEATLCQNYFELGKNLESEGMVFFQHSYGKWIRMIRDSGFEILDLVELRPKESSKTSYDYVSLEWARKWPAENIWKLRKA